MNEEEARRLGFKSLAAHDEAHRLVLLPRDHPEALDIEERFWVKELLFHCHYSAASTCTYNRSGTP